MYNIFKSKYTIQLLIDALRTHGLPGSQFTIVTDYFHPLPFPSLLSSSSPCRQRSHVGSVALYHHGDAPLTSECTSSLFSPAALQSHIG